MFHVPSGSERVCCCCCCWKCALQIDSLENSEYNFVNGAAGSTARISPDGRGRQCAESNINTAAPSAPETPCSSNGIAVRDLWPGALINLWKICKMGNRIREARK